MADIVSARQEGRELAEKCGFAGSDPTLVATVISELARNVVLYAETGEIILEKVYLSPHYGIAITSRDRGPGIEDVERALLGGYSTSGGLGLGLSGIRCLVDEFHVDTAVDSGTVVTARIWCRRRAKAPA